MFTDVSFLLGAASASQFPVDQGYEIAFAGRSNAGKSSAINAIVARRNIARTSKTPGRTREINFFSLNTQVRLVDLPGYGFAKAGRKIQDQWLQLVETYLSNRQSLRLLVIVMDVRRPFTVLDTQLLDWCSASAVAVHILLSKSDKLSRSKAIRVEQIALESIVNYPTAVSIQRFSAQDGSGVATVRERLLAAIS